MWQWKGNKQPSVVQEKPRVSVEQKGCAPNNCTCCCWLTTALSLCSLGQMCAAGGLTVSAGCWWNRNALPWPLRTHCCFPQRSCSVPRHLTALEGQNQGWPCTLICLKMFGSSNKLLLLLSYVAVMLHHEKGCCALAPRSSQVFVVMTVRAFVPPYPPEPMGH